MEQKLGGGRASARRSLRFMFAIWGSRLHDCTHTSHSRSQMKLGCPRFSITIGFCPYQFPMNPLAFFMLRLPSSIALSLWQPCDSQYSTVLLFGRKVVVWCKCALQVNKNNNFAITQSRILLWSSVLRNTCSSAFCSTFVGHVH